MMQLLLAMSFASFAVGAQPDKEIAPVERLWVGSPVAGTLMRFNDSLRTGTTVTKDQELFLVADENWKKSWVRSPVSGIVLNLHFRENLTNRFIRADEPILCIGYVKQE